MTKSEWNRVFAWVMGHFPQWKPDAGVSAIWYGEVGRGCTPDEFCAAAREAMQESPDFPPTLPRITKALLDADEENPELIAAEEWELVLDGHPPTDPRTIKALRAVGGQEKARLTDYSELKWVEKRFLEVWRYADDGMTQERRQRKFALLSGRLQPLLKGKSA